MNDSGYPTHKSSGKAAFLLLFRGNDWSRDLSPSEIQATMSRWMDWFNGLVEDGRCRGGSPLGNTGKIVTGKNKAVSDGPFKESKEAVGGFFYLEVRDLEEAVAIAQQCPALAYGIVVEVRPIQNTCAATGFRFESEDERVGASEFAFAQK